MPVTTLTVDPDLHAPPAKRLQPAHPISVPLQSWSGGELSLRPCDLTKCTRKYALSLTEYLRARTRSRSMTAKTYFYFFFLQADAGVFREHVLPGRDALFCCYWCVVCMLCNGSLMILDPLAERSKVRLPTPVYALARPWARP